MRLHISSSNRASSVVRLKQIVARINSEYNIDGLCRELPDRVAALYKKKGGKLKK